MKNWSGGMLILALALIMVLSYSFMGNQSTKLSEYSSNLHPKEEDSSKPSQLKLKHSKHPPKMPHLVNVEGVGDLYNMDIVNESKYLLVWAQMQWLLSRSDSLPETAQGVKEASRAWKDLLSTIEKEKASKFTEDKECPFCISTFNKTSGSGSILELPCGLIEDSSITLVGIPNGSFHIELIGGFQVAEEPKPPIILHYNVTLPGEKLTEEPVIVQNAWGNELGWGKEEKCPAHGSSNILKVDGLARCNEQVTRSLVEEFHNESNPSNDKMANASVHMSGNFPFVEGNPFAATLWAGPEGFHMTVNGRHETSFAYREVRNLNHGWLMESRWQVV